MSAEEKKTEIQAMKDHEERHAKRIIATRNALDQRMSKVHPASCALLRWRVT